MVTQAARTKQSMLKHRPAADLHSTHSHAHAHALCASKLTVGNIGRGGHRCNVRDGVAQRVCGVELRILTR